MSAPQEPRAPGLAGRVVRGTLYIVAGSWTTYVVNFAIAIALARLLGPEAMGLYAIAVAINEFIGILNGLSISPALVQSREESEELYDTGYAMSLGQGVVGLLAAGMVAPFLWVQRSPELAWFVLLLGLNRVMSLLADAVYSRMDRHMQYGPIALMTLASSSLPNVAALGLALWGFGASSLIARDLLFGAISIALVHLWSGYRFRGRASREAFRKIMRFSGPMFLSRTVDLLFLRFDRLVVGWLMGNASVGLYSQARFLSEAGYTVTQPITRVTFSVYSRLQDDPARLSRSYRIVNYFLGRVLLCGAAALIVYPRPTIQLLLGEEWLAAAPVLWVLGFHGALFPLLVNMQVLLFARAAMRANLRIRLAQLVVFIPGVLVAASFEDLRGVALAMLAANLLGCGLSAWANHEAVGRGFLLDLVTPALAVAVAYGFCSWLETGSWLAGAPYWVRPFLPPLVVAVVVVLVERARVLRELRQLLAQLRSASPAAAPVE